ncbi:hypothetical protein BST38_13455 [Mycolicibacterium parafortuitum]|nr:hypothetical protein BST38_13455 [Mycolicibacterium parafortuitum]
MELMMLFARFDARLRAGIYDRQLSVGVAPEPGSPLAAHRARLTSPAERMAIAGTLRRCVRDARQGTSASRIPVDVANVVAAEGLIERIVGRLLAPHPVGDRGVARLRLVLADGSGPLYRGGRGDLAGRLGAALAAL